MYLTVISKHITDKMKFWQAAWWPCRLEGTLSENIHSDSKENFKKLCCWKVSHTFFVIFLVRVPIVILIFPFFPYATFIQNCPEPCAFRCYSPVSLISTLGFWIILWKAFLPISRLSECESTTWTSDHSSAPNCDGSLVPKPHFLTSIGLLVFSC